MKFKVKYHSPPISEVAKEMIVDVPESDDLTIAEAVESVNCVQRAIGRPLVTAEDILSIGATK